MITHSLKDLKNVNKSYMGTYRPGDSRIQKWETHKKLNKYKRFADVSVCTLDDFIDKSLLHYVLTVRYNKNKIRYEMREIYGKALAIKDNQTSDWALDLKSLINISGMCVSELIHNIRLYLGYPARFWRYDKLELVPVELFRIREAWLMTQKNVSILQVEETLYL